ncbi:unnamed protein product [Caenorhabditis bovis]|uniref:RNA helicase n=1 Tax=Caenorhabditis bovis TaxID=2654633 RepID=A0A8S1FDP3_9PELO|nr:unnamed protein product [Caenorhabditis bovis]
MSGQTYFAGQQQQQQPQQLSPQQQPQQQQQPAAQNGWSNYTQQSNGFAQSNGYHHQANGGFQPMNGGGYYGGFGHATIAPPHQNGYGVPPPNFVQANMAQLMAAQQTGLYSHQFFHPPPPIMSDANEQQNGSQNGYYHRNQENGYQQKSFSSFNQNMNDGSEPTNWNSQSAGSDSTEKQLFHRTDSGINFDKYENIPVQVSGGDPPAAIEEFADADLHEWIRENVNRSGYTKPTPVQKHSIPTLLANRDLMSCAQTGSGKTAAFLLPIINHILVNGPDGIKPVSALVLSPTRELAIQIHKEAAKFSYRTNIVTAILYGGRENYRDQVNRLRAGCHILIATPGRLIDIIDQGYVGLEGCRYLVLDEADRMLDMGFEPQIRKIVGLGMPSKENRTTAMFSATFPKEIQILAKDFLKNDYVFLAVGRVGSTSENIQQRLLWVDEIDKRRNLMQIISEEAPQNLILCFVETKKGANELSFFLNRQQVRAVAIHGDLKQPERERNLDLFRSGQYPVLVATAVAARGLDIPNVRHVINYDLPGDSDEYVHRIGRTGRCGNVGCATSFFNDKNRGIGRDLMSLVEESNQEVPDWLRRVAAEGRINTGNRYSGNRRFGGTDHRRGGGYTNMHNNFGQTPNQGFGNGFAPMYGNGPRRPFPSNGGFGAHNGLANGFAPRGRGMFAAIEHGTFFLRHASESEGGFSNGMHRNNMQMGMPFCGNSDGTIGHWQAPRA